MKFTAFHHTMNLQTSINSSLYTVSHTNGATEQLPDSVVVNHCFLDLGVMVLVHFVFDMCFFVRQREIKLTMEAKTKFEVQNRH